MGPADGLVMEDERKESKMTCRLGLKQLSECGQLTDRRKIKGGAC